MSCGYAAAITAGVCEAALDADACCGGAAMPVDAKAEMMIASAAAVATATSGCAVRLARELSWCRAGTLRVGLA
jgi:hypothetical protein